MKKSRLREALKAYKFEFTLLAIILICFFSLIGYYAYAGKLVDNDGNPIKFCSGDKNNTLWERIVRKWKITKTEK
jgi:hypothetical protein